MSSAMALLLLQLMTGAGPRAATAQTRPAAACTVSGVVADAVSGAPIADATVELTAPDGNREQTSGRDGGFVFAGLPAGRYELFAERQGYQTARYLQHANFFSTVVAGPGLRTTGLRLELEPEAVLDGTVSDEGGDAVRGARVELFRRNPDSGEVARLEDGMTDDLGNYEFAPLAPGVYYVAVMAKPWYNVPSWPPSNPPPPPARVVISTIIRPPMLHADLDFLYPVTFYVGATDWREAAPIAIRSGGRVQADVTLVATRPEHITVHQEPQSGPGPRYPPAVIPDAFGQPLYGTLSGNQVTRPTADGGLDLFLSLTPGEYLMQRGPDGTSTPMTVTGDAEMTLADSSATPAGTDVGGTLQLASGGPPPAGFMVILTEPPRVWNARTGPHGEFVFHNIMPGTYALRTPAGPLLTVTVSGQPVTVQAVIQGRRAVASVKGEVVEQGESASGVLVVLAPEATVSWQDARMDQSDSDGTFSLSNVLPGKYRLIAVRAGWDLVQTPDEFLQKYGAKAIEVEIPAGLRSFPLKPVEVQP